MKPEKPNVAVVVGRFQVPMLHPGHKELLDKVRSEHTKVIVILGSAHAINTRKDPMDYKTRELMMRAEYPEFTITGIKDQRSDNLWSEELDQIIDSLTNPNDYIVLYGGRDSFINHYTGKFETKELEPTVFYSGTMYREDMWDKSMDNPAFRAGIIRAAYSRFPTTHPTVDIAVFNHDKTQIILGSKTDDIKNNLWRLPGGFVDVTDKNFVAAAKRELREELGNMEVGNFKYVIDMKVNDWRYRNQEDVKLHTILFETVHIFGAPRPGDDLQRAKWFNFNEKLLKEIDIVPGHKPLLEYLIYGKEGAPLFTEEDIREAFDNPKYK